MIDELHSIRERMSKADWIAPLPPPVRDPIEPQLESGAEAFLMLLYLCIAVTLFCHFTPTVLTWLFRG